MRMTCDILRNVRIDKRAKQPRYSQLSEQLKALILKESLPVGEPIPSDNALMSRFSLSRSTVRQAVDELEKDGLIERVHGKGTYVKNSVSANEQKKLRRIVFFMDEEFKTYSENRGFYSDLALHINLSLSALGCQVRPFFAEDGSRINMDIFADGEYDGMLFMGKHLLGNKTVIEKNIGRLGCPVVILDAEIKIDGAVVISGKNEDGGRLAAEYLAALGAKRLAFVGDRQGNYFKRLKGYIHGAKEHNLICGKENIWFDVKKAAAELPGRLAETDGIFFCADWIAAEVLTDLKRRGADIQRDKHIISYDGTKLLGLAVPGVRSVCVDRAEMTLRAVEALKGEIKPGVIYVSTSL